MKFNVLLGGYKASIEICDRSPFTGTITTEEFGVGSLKGTRDGNELSGTVDLDGHEAKFKAELEGNTLSGSVRYGWFFSETFKGTRQDERSPDDSAARGRV